MPESCFVAKLSYYLDLNEEEEELLAALERTEMSYKRGKDVRRAGDQNDKFYTIKEGWAYSYTDLIDGRRQIVQVHIPGDLVGLPDLAFDTTTTTLHSATELVLCPMPKATLDDIFVKSPRLTALLFTMSNRDQVIFTELLRAIARMDARERMAHFLLQLASRLRVTNPEMRNAFRLPLSQRELGDALGLTNVYISKTIGRLEMEGLIARSNGKITLLEEEELSELCDFVNRFEDMDTDWFPRRDP